MPTLREFIADGKSRGKSKDQVREAIGIYTNQFGAFDDERGEFEPEKIFQESPLDNVPKEDKQKFRNVLTPEQVSRSRARKYFEHKDKRSYQNDFMLDQRARYEMGLKDGASVDYNGVVTYLTDVTAPYAKAKREGATAGQILKGTGASIIEGAATFTKVIGEKFIREHFPWMKDEAREAGTQVKSKILDITPKEWEKSRDIMQQEASRPLEGDKLDKSMQWVKQGLMIVGDNAPNLIAGAVNPAIGFTFMYTQMSESMYQTLEEMGIDKDLADNYSMLYAAVATPIEYIESAGRVGAAFGGRKASKVIGKPIRRAVAKMLKEAGINIGEEISQDVAFNLIYNAALIKSNEKFGTKFEAKSMTAEDFRQTAKASLQMSAVLDAVGIPTRYGRRKIQLKKTQDSLAKNFGLTATKAHQVATEMSMAGSQAELDAIHSELQGYVERKQEMVDSLNQELPIFQKDKTDPIPMENGTPWTDADFDTLRDNNDDEQIAEMIDGEVGEILLRAAKGDKQARADYNRIIIEGKEAFFGEENQSGESDATDDGGFVRETVDSIREKVEAIGGGNLGVGYDGVSPYFNDDGLSGASVTVGEKETFEQAHLRELLNVDLGRQVKPLGETEYRDKYSHERKQEIRAKIAEYEAMEEQKSQADTKPVSEEKVAPEDAEGALEKQKDRVRKDGRIGVVETELKSWVRVDWSDGTTTTERKDDPELEIIDGNGFVEDRQELLDLVVPKEEQATPEQEKESSLHGEREIGLTNDEIDSLRESHGYDALTPLEKETVEQWTENAKRKGLDLLAEKTARKVLDNPYVLLPEEREGMHLRVVQLENNLDRTFEEIGRLGLKGADTTYLVAQITEMQEEHSLILEAMRISQSLAGKALKAVDTRISRDNYKVSNVIRIATEGKGKKLTPRQQKELTDLALELKEWEGLAKQLQSELEELEKKGSQSAAEDFVGEEASSIKVRRRKSAILKDRNAVKAELRKVGYRVNDITGVTVEVSGLISKLAVTYIQDGAMTLDEVVKKVRADMPQISDKDVWDSLGGRNKQAKKKARDEVAERVGELKKQAKISGQIEDAMNGIFDEKRATTPSSAEVQKLRKRLRELQVTAENAVTDEAQLEKILKKISEVESAIEERRYPQKKGVVSESERIADAKQKLSELKRLLNTNALIDNLESRIKNNNYEGLFTAPRQKAIKSNELNNALLKAYQLKRQIRNRVYNMRKKTAKDAVIETAGFVRAIKATGDMSYLLRQGLIPSLGHPILASKAARGAFKAFFSGNTADAIDLALKGDSMQIHRDKYGLYLSTLDASLTEREESFASAWADRIPNWMGGIIIKASERHMITGLNMLRAGLFDQYIKQNPNASEESKFAYARYVNIMTGRGDLKWLTTSPAFQAVMFSPKFTSSRLQAIPVAANSFIKHKELRGEIARQWTAFVGTGLSVLGLAAMAGLKVGLDPDDPDFGKIVIDGKIHIDVWGGLQQPVRVFMRAVKLGKDRAVGEENNTNLADVAWKFFKYKASPAVTTGYELFTGKDWVTNKDVTVGEVAATAALPLIFESAIEAYQMDLDALETAVSLGGEFSGLGVQTYERDKKKKVKKTSNW